MPIPTQFSISLELAKLLPAQAALTYGAEAIVSFVRELRRSGSDFLVEEDLAAIFSRGKVVSSLETHFRDVVKVASFTPLHAGSEIILDAGPGPTVRRALKDRYYMATVIQLSCLCFLHETTTLAAALVESMHKRYELGIKGATPDADYDGILATLLACKSQTSQYPWELLVSLVESKFERSTKWFCAINSPLRRLSPNILLGAMDYLYLVQSLPEDRIMMVENQMGLVPVVLWAHCVLGLTVLVKASPDGDVVFGRSPNPQVVINWSDEWQLGEGQSGLKGSSFPAIYLLDGNMDVVLSIVAEHDEALKIEGEEKLRLRAYGTILLRRFFNQHSIVVDDDPVYTETVQFTAAIAIVVSRVLCRVPLNGDSDEIPEQCYGRTECWRILNSTEMLFSGIALNRKEVDQYVEQFTGVQVSKMTLPPTLRTNHKGAKSYFPRNSSFLKRMIKPLASLILAFAQVVDLESCSDMLLRYEPQGWVEHGISAWKGIDPITIDSDHWYTIVLKLMVGPTEWTTCFRSSSDIGFLFSHRGWSIFFNSIGDKDPGQVNPELLSIRRGVPTSTRTNERKYQISDAPSIWTKGMRWQPMEVDTRDSYLPRCLVPVLKRTEQYSSRGRKFLLKIRYDIDQSGAPLGAGEEAQFSVYASYSKFLQVLWGVIKTPACPHPKGGNELLELDMGVITTKGFNWFEGNHFDDRICINLVKGDARARWLTINGVIRDEQRGMNPKMTRQVMLRCDDCCEDCAVQTASAMPGKWLVIL